MLRDLQSGQSWEACARYGLSVTCVTPGGWHVLVIEFYPQMLALGFQLISPSVLLSLGLPRVPPPLPVLAMAWHLRVVSGERPETSVKGIRLSLVSGRRDSGLEMCSWHQGLPWQEVVSSQHLHATPSSRFP